MNIQNHFSYQKKERNNADNFNNFDTFQLINSQQDNSYLSFETKFEQLEQQPNKNFLEEVGDVDDFDNLYLFGNYLYHGLRFQKHLEKLESIFRCKAILAGNYLDSYYDYDDNCNDGEYVSLVGGDYNLVYETFVMKNISLVISPKCGAIQTIYLPYDEWEQIKGRTTKNRYSYANGEYQVKKMISLDMVRAIGLPARYLRLVGKDELIEIYITDMLELMMKYNIDLPIVDTSDYNRPLVLSKDYRTSYPLRKKIK